MADKSDGFVSIWWDIWFWIFVVIKVTGHTFAAWSWGWALLPFIPAIGEVIKHFGL